MQQKEIKHFNSRGKDGHHDLNTTLDCTPLSPYKRVSYYTNMQLHTSSSCLIHFFCYEGVLILHNFLNQERNLKSNVVSVKIALRFINIFLKTIKNDRLKGNL